MMYDAAMRTVQRGDKHFRWRGENVSRVETLFDSVMALSMTLVIVSLEVPERYSDLAEWNPHRDVCVSANRVRGGFMFTSMRWSHRRYALLVPLLALVTGCGFPLVFANELAEGEFNRRLSVSGPVELTARAGSGNITIQTGQTGIVQVKATVRARARTMAAADDKLARLLADPPVTQDGNHVEVGRIPDRELRRSVSISYVITVPDTTAVDANVGSGRISVDGVVGPVDAHIGSGLWTGHVGSNSTQSPAMSTSTVDANCRIVVRCGNANGPAGWMSPWTLFDSVMAWSVQVAGRPHRLCQ